MFFDMLFYAISLPTKHAKDASSTGITGTIPPTTMVQTLPKRHWFFSHNSLKMQQPLWQPFKSKIPIDMLIREKDKQTLQDIFATIHLPVEVWAYGSRVTGTAHTGSDLDFSSEAKT
jgi:hypothetical protein